MIKPRYLPDNTSYAREGDKGRTARAFPERIVPLATLNVEENDTDKVDAGTHEPLEHHCTVQLM